MERRVLIVEHDSEFALGMASVLKGAGYQTGLAEDGSAALRELAKRRHDLIVLRAELPDQSGFVLSGQIKKSQSGQGIAILLLSSEVDRDGMAQHAKSPNGVEGYLSVPFEMKELIDVATRLVPLAESAPPSDEDQQMEASLDAALAPGGSKAKEQAAAGPPPIKAPPPGGPPRLPKRERRSAMTEEDRAFLDRAFQSIADRKAELLAESRQLRRTVPRREAMGSPEAKIQILREELKLREAQIARLSEIWTVRERELLSVEDRLHEKDVELQGLKMQVDDLLRRFSDAQQNLLLKEKEHGATVDDLLLQKFATEKDLIEVVASKEKDIHAIRKEIALRDEELTRRVGELESSRKEHEKLEKQLNVATLEFEVKEQNLNHAVQTRDAELAALRAELEKTRGEFAQAVGERDRKISDWERSFQDKSDELLGARQERDSTVRNLEARLGAADAHAAQSDTEIKRLRGERVEFEKKVAQQVAELEAQLNEFRVQREDLRIQRDGLAQTMTDRLAERDGKIVQLEQELAESNRRKEQQETELGAQIQRQVERIGELEGEVEAAQAQLVDRESELQAQMAERVSEQKAILAAREQELLGQLSARESHWQAEVNGLNEARQQLELTFNEKLRSAEAQILELSGLNGNLGQQLDDVRSALGQREQRLEQLRVELEKTAQDRTVREGELKTARNEISRVKGILKQTEEAKATQEREFKVALGEARVESESWHARLEAEQQAHQKLQSDSGRAIESLTHKRNDLTSKLASETAAVQDLSEQLSLANQELGERVAEVTQLSSQLNQAEDARQNAEERLQTLSEESERRDALLQNDIASKTKDLSDLQRKLVQLSQERQRQVEALTREVSIKAEHLKQIEAKLRVAGDESRRKEEELSSKLGAVTNELQSVRLSLGEQLQVAKTAHSKAIGERDQLRTTLTGQLQHAMAKVQEVTSLLQQTRVEGKRAQEDLQAKLSRAEARLAQLTHEFQSKGAKSEQETKEAVQQLSLRSRKIQELETALEAAHSGKIRVEKELTARVVAADSKLNESSARLSALLRERKEVEARHLREVEELNAKHKAELERREAMKSQETARLQQAVLEKSKALKVVELELARFKGKPAGQPARPPTLNTPAPSNAPATTNAGPKPQSKAIRGEPPRQSVPPATGREPATAQTSRFPNGNAAKAKEPAAKPSPVNAPPTPPEQEDSFSESTLVLQIDEDAAEWSSVVDDLDK